jgi:hypothetical protein
MNMILKDLVEITENPMKEDGLLMLKPQDMM